MVQPNSERMAMGSVTEYGSRQSELGLEASFSGEGPSPDIVALRRDSSSTTDDGVSNLDDDSDAQSLISRGDSPETIAHEPNARRVGGDRSIWSLTGSVAAATTSITAAAVTSTRTSSDSMRHKRTLSEEERAGQGQLLRKACDLCTKRKRKCNGQHPCSQCVETGVRNQCVYSPRLKSGRKKKVRIDGILYEEGGSGLTLVAGNGARRGNGGYAVDTAAGRFSASGAVGLAGHVENFFLATYLRDFNRIVPLTSESSVTEGMLEVLSPAVVSSGLSAASPIKQPESRRQAKQAVFWGVVAMGSRILGANEESTTRYLGLMRTALRECFDCNDKEVVQAYLLLSTVETMRGNEEAGKRYLDHAHTMHNGNAMGPEGKLLSDRPEQDECLDLVFQIYGQPDGCVGTLSSTSVGGGTVRRGGGARAGGQAAGGGGGMPASAVDEMIAQAMSPPTDTQSGPLKALKYLSTACGLSSEVFDPTNKCVTVKQYLGEMDTALKGANSLFKHTDLSECITGVVMVKIWGGTTVLMRSWGKLADKEVGLAQVEEGVGYALTRPGLMTFPMWWHVLHCAAVVLAHFGRDDTYMRLRETFNKNTFPGTEMPPIGSYSPGAICPQLGGSCSKLAFWLQVRGTMCSEPDWRPQFAEGLSAESESAAYEATLDRHNVCIHQKKENEEYTKTLRANMMAAMEKAKMVGVDCVDEGGGGKGLVEQGHGQAPPPPSEHNATLGHLTEIGVGAQIPDLAGLDALVGGDIDLDPLGVEFDLSQLQEADNVGGAGGGGGQESMPAPVVVGLSERGHVMEIPASVQTGKSWDAALAAVGAGGGVPLLSRDTSFGMAGSVVGGGPMSRDTSFGMAGSVVGGAPISRDTSFGMAGLVMGGGPLSRDTSFGILGHAAASGMVGSSPPGVRAGEPLSRQSSLDMNTIMQMVSSDEELKKREGGNPDAIDNALAFGEGPAKELFGVELSTS